MKMGKSLRDAEQLQLVLLLNGSMFRLELGVVEDHCDRAFVVLNTCAPAVA
jgi:hypothetical protein